jgi:cell division transport system permease protein
MKRILINAFRNIRRSPNQALAAIMVLTLTFFVAQLFVLISWSTTVVTTYFETRPQVTAFFTNEITEEHLLNLKEQLQTLPYVREVTYISKKEALSIYQEQNKDNPLLLEMVTAEILPASLEVSATGIDFLPKVKEELEKSKGVEEVVYHQQVVDTLRQWSQGIRTGGISLVVFLTVTSLLVISLIISMKVASKRQEIATMKLLGAKPWFVVGPFVAEGALYGLVASVISWGTLYVLLLYATPILLSYLGDIPLLPIPFWFMGSLLAATAGFSLLIGMISGSASSRRFGT